MVTATSVGRAAGRAVAFLVYGRKVSPLPRTNRTRQTLAQQLEEGRVVELTESEYDRGKRDTPGWQVVPLASGYAVSQESKPIFGCRSELGTEGRRYYGRRLTRMERMQLAPLLDCPVTRGRLELGRWFDVEPAASADRQILPFRPPGSPQIVIITGLRKQIDGGTIIVYEEEGETISSGASTSVLTALQQFVLSIIGTRRRVPLAVGEADEELYARLAENRWAPEIPGDTFEYLTSARPSLLPIDRPYGGEEDELFRLLWREHGRCYVTTLRSDEYRELRRYLRALGDAA